MHKRIQLAIIAGVMVSLTACHLTDVRELSGLNQVKRCDQHCQQHATSAPEPVAISVSAPAAPDFKYTKGSASQDTDK